VTKSISRSEPHRRTRRDHATETAEDYVEAVAEILQEQPDCRVRDLARRFAVSHVTVNRIVGRLQNEGLVATEPYQPITLTPKGTRLAAKCRKRHQIVYQFLLAIGVDEATAAVDAEGIEHHVSPKTLQRFRELSSRPGIRCRAT
jgi:DtxR family manganese transport transcriptional regulator